MSSSRATHKAVNFDIRKFKNRDGDCDQIDFLHSIGKPPPLYTKKVRCLSENTLFPHDVTFKNRPQGNPKIWLFPA